MARSLWNGNRPTDYFEVGGVVGLNDWIDQRLAEHNGQGDDKKMKPKATAILKVKEAFKATAKAAERPSAEKKK